MLAYQLLVNGLIAGSFYALIGLGFSLQHQVSRFFDFGYFAVSLVGAYSCWAITRFLPCWRGVQPRPTLLLAVLVGISCAAATGWLLERLVYRRLRTRGTSSLMMLLASLSCYTVLVNLVSLAAGDGVRVFHQAVDPRTVALTVPGLGTAYATRVQCAAGTLAIIVGAALGVVLERSNWGVRVRAVADDPELATIHGLDAEAIRSAVHRLGGGLAGLGAIFIALDTDLTPSMGNRVLLTVTASLIIGGADRLFGVVIGAYMVALTQHLSALAIATRWQDAVVFLILCLLLLVRRAGLFTAGHRDSVCA